MPVKLNDDGSITGIDVTGKAKDIKNIAYYTPKFFNKTVLTGKGGNSKGLLNESIDPKNIKNGYANTDPNMEYSIAYVGNKKVYSIPVYMIKNDIWELIEEFDIPDEAVKIAERGNEKIYLWLPIHAIQVEEESVPNPTAGAGYKTTTRRTSISMHMFLFHSTDATNKAHKRVNHIQSFITGAKANNSKINTYYEDTIYTIYSLKNIDNALTAEGYNVDQNVLRDFVQNYSLYTELCKAAERWQTKADYYIADVVINNIVKHHPYLISDPNDIKWNTEYTGSIAYCVQRLEEYNVPLDIYKTMYDKLSAVLPDNILIRICRGNLNLKLSNTLNHMNTNRQLLNTCPCITHVKTTIPFSKEQTEAIESTAPLTLVQSGAGTGKSTVILGRIKHMMENGVDPEDIMVLSFTNAAADHICEITSLMLRRMAKKDPAMANRRVHSMTIASMLHTIYSANFPDHALSSINTIINSIDIYYPNGGRTNVHDQFLKDFKETLYGLIAQNGTEKKRKYTQLDNFVESHMDDVLDTLQTIQQTSLELESIICYHKMDTLIEPPETNTKHLIIDEVQDNSIAEFIYSVKYTDKHHCSMYIVGDCSQTLYEFRASNPKALNVLENSGVFETHKLQTNYRSNQEILDFANVLLDNIEANKYAQIQLKANSLRPVTLTSFQDAVQMHYYLVDTKTATDDMIPHSIHIDANKYIQNVMNRDEQLCILAHTRKTLTAVKQELRNNFPQLQQVKDNDGNVIYDPIYDLCPIRTNDDAHFSEFIKRFWDRVTYTPPMHIMDTISAEFNTNMYASYNGQVSAYLQYKRDSARRFMDRFIAQYGATIKEWERQVTNSTLSMTDMMSNIKQIMIDFEIKSSAQAQAMNSAKNAAKKNSDEAANAKIIVSTIHSAKGLEFDNVLVYYHSKPEGEMDEADKRMYYVALTRAKKSEFIFAYGKMKNPKIQGDYEKIVADLAKVPVKKLDPSLLTGFTSNKNDAKKAKDDTSVTTLDASKFSNGPVAAQTDDDTDTQATTTDTNDPQDGTTDGSTPSGNPKDPNED